jgi:hypothetical protein
MTDQSVTQTTAPHGCAYLSESSNTTSCNGPPDWRIIYSDRAGNPIGTDMVCQGHATAQLGRGQRMGASNRARIEPPTVDHP